MAKADPNWKAKVRAWQSSNMSPKEWCKINQIPYTTLISWKTRLDKLKGKKAPNKLTPKNFIELKQTSTDDSGILLEVFGVQIQLKNEFNKATLKACIECLRGSLC